jgi:hypothetical protein
MAVDRPFPKGTFKIELGPGQHEVSAIFKPTQSTIVFSRTRPGELASESPIRRCTRGAALLAARSVSGAPSDGYTILVTTTSLAVNETERGHLTQSLYIKLDPML